MAYRIVPAGGWSNLKPIRTPRERKPSHLEFLRLLPCACCLTTGTVTIGCDPAHLRAASLRHGKAHTGKAEKPSDRWALPLCRHHHDQQHGMSETVFWSMYRIDPFLLSLVLWGITGDEHEAFAVLRFHATSSI